MAEKNEQSVKASGEQMLYANILNKGMIVGILILLLTYAVYVSGILPTFLPVEEVPKTWHYSVAEYTHEYNAPTGLSSEGSHAIIRMFIIYFPSQRIVHYIFSDFVQFPVIADNVLIYPVR